MGRTSRRLYSGEEVDVALAKLEQSARKQRGVDPRAGVKLKAAERDLLAVAETIRDFLTSAVKGDKKLLTDVFGDMERLYRVHAVMDATELSETNKNDDRWWQMKESVKIIEEVLDKLGRFKPWTGVPKKPESLTYSPLPARRLTPGSALHLKPKVTGSELAGLTFSCLPALPNNLTFNGGEIVGELVPGYEIFERTYTVTACNIAGSVTCELVFGVRYPKPENLAYQFSENCFTGDSIKWAPTFDGGPVKSWSCAPELPKGLDFDAGTGVISGMPHKPGDRTKYTVTAKNTDGQAQTELEFKVNLAPPVRLSYPEAAGTFPFGAGMYLHPEVELKKLAPSIKQVAKWGRVFASSGAYMGTKWGRARQVLVGSMVTVGTLPQLTYTVEPALPDGLDIAEGTGIISGTSKVEIPMSRFKVSVSNEGGSASCDINFAIKMIPPMNLKYPDLRKILYTGESVNIEPEVQGIVQEWTVEPALPEGMGIDESVGTLWGAPVAPVKEETYVVTASNTQGQAQRKLIFAVQRVPPSQLMYHGLQLEYPLGRPMELSPMVNGEVDKYTVEPELPKGFALDAVSGVIKGVPEEVIDTMAFEVTAENESGATRTTVAFCVKVIPPEDLQYPQVVDEYATGEKIHLVPQMTGGVDRFSVEPSLPEGIALDPETGIISGTASAVMEESTFVVVAENEAGGTSVELTFRIVSKAPKGLVYPQVEAGTKYLVDIAVDWSAQLEKEHGASFKVEPPLPEGLALNEDTGLISGTPDTETEVADYVVTASNWSGSCSYTINFGICKPPEKPWYMEKESMGKRLENITDLKLMPEDPSSRERGKGIDWMLWMVHRAFLDDPTLKVLDFSGMTMPFGNKEPRIAPKLAKAMATNTHMEILNLTSSNLRIPEMLEMTESLKRNSGLQQLQVGNNFLDSLTVQGLYEALATVGETSKIWKVDTDCQHHVSSLGRPAEEAIAKMAQKNTNIRTINQKMFDAHWLSELNRACQKNTDLLRRKRVGAKAEEEELAVPPQKKTLATVIFNTVPVGEEGQTAAWEVFEAEDAPSNVIRRIIANSKKFPTKDQLLNQAKKVGVSMKFKDAPPAIKDFRDLLMNTMKNTEARFIDNTRAEVQGVIRGWEEKNGRWTIEVGDKENKRYAFACDKDPTFQVSDELAEWIAPPDDCFGDGEKSEEKEALG